MEQYVSAGGKGRTRDLIRQLGWRYLINPLDPRDPEDIAHMVDCGAWPAFVAWKAGKIAENMLDLEAFEVALDRYGPTADMVVLPDIVEGGVASLDLSARWMNRCLATTSKVLISVQNDMEPRHLRPYVGAKVGIFLGGSTEWKKDTMRSWGEFCHEVGCHYHVARVNTPRRYAIARWSGAHSTDGTSGTKFSKNMPKIDAARRQMTLFMPGSEAA